MGPSIAPAFDDSDWLTIEQAAQRLNGTPAAVTTLLQEGTLVHRAVRGRILIDPADVQRLLQQQRQPHAPTVESPLFTKPEAAAYLRCSLSHLHRVLRHGKLPRLTFGRIVRIRRQDCDAWIERNMSRTSERSG